MITVAAPDFDLRFTLECGQAFRWTERGGAYYGFIPVRPETYGIGGAQCAVRLRQDGDRVTADTADSRLTDRDVIRYLALDLDLPRVLAQIDVDAQIHDAITRFRGLRVLRQDSWETLASFILSSFNNIKRIQGMIERLAQHFGTPVAFNGFRGCSFPSPAVLAAVPEWRLRELGLGFRAPYLRETARLIADGAISLETLHRTEYRVTKASLMHCDGVGDKVADCVALFGFEKYEAFPVDVWIARAMRYYFRRSKMTPKRIHDFADEHFGQYAGYAQQYLFHYVRGARLTSGMERPPAPAAAGSR